MGAPWWVGLGFVLVMAVVVAFWGRQLLQLWRDLRSGRARPDELWPPGRTIEQPPGPPRTHRDAPPPGDDWI